MKINIFQKKRNNVYRASFSLHIIVISPEKLLIGAFPIWSGATLLELFILYN